MLCVELMLWRQSESLIRLGVQSCFKLYSRLTIARLQIPVFKCMLMERIGVQAEGKDRFSVKPLPVRRLLLADLHQHGLAECRHRRGPPGRPCLLPDQLQPGDPSSNPCGRCHLPR